MFSFYRLVEALDNLDETVSIPRPNDIKDPKFRNIAGDFWKAREKASDAQRKYNENPSKDNHEAYTKATNQMNDASKRAKDYKETGRDPGEGAYTNPRRKQRQTSYRQPSGISDKVRAAMYLVPLGVLVAHRIYTAYLEHKKKECNKITDPKQKKICLAKKQIEATRKSIQSLHSSIPKCSKAKNPEACRQAINKHISQEQGKIKKLESSIS